MVEKLLEVKDKILVVVSTGLTLCLIVNVILNVIESKKNKIQTHEEDLHHLQYALFPKVHQMKRQVNVFVQ